MAAHTQHAPFFAGLRAANRILVMSSSEVETYAAYAPQAEVLAVPHGVDTQFFRPALGTRPDRRFRVLTVGNWLRDYSLWNQVARRWLATQEEFEWAILASPYNERVALEGLPANDSRIIVLPRLSDEALLAEYQQADVLFLPLKDALANNALLEALACGLPIVATDLPAIREYGGDVVRYVPGGDSEAAWVALQQMAINRDTRVDLQRRCRARAEAEYAWTVVAQRHYDLYSQ
jgi:glycosyltransferase involved in cell wall biosynthesis